MSTVTLTLKGMEAHVVFDYGVNTTGAYTILFDEDGNTLAETDTTRYSGFCTFCILYAETCKVYDHRRQVEASDIADALRDLHGDCTCDDDF